MLFGWETVTFKTKLCMIYDVITPSLNTFAFLPCLLSGPLLSNSRCPALPCFCALYYWFYTISNDRSTLCLAFPPCHSGEWIIHARAARWWRAIMWGEQNTRACLWGTLLSKDPRTALWEGGAGSATAYCTASLYGLLLRPQLLHPGCPHDITVPWRLSWQSHVSSAPEGLCLQSGAVKPSTGTMQ